MLIRRLIEEANSSKTPLAKPESLEGMISRWENGKAEPSALYRRLLGRVFGENPDAFKFSRPGSDDDLSLLLPQAAHAGLLSVYETTFRHYVAADNLYGPLAALPPILAQLRQLLSLCETTGSLCRENVLRIALRYAELAGWLYQDLGQLGRAMQWTNKALEISNEFGDEAHTSYTFMRKSNVASDAGDGAGALRFANAALSRASQLSPRLRAVALRQQANAFSLLGKCIDAERAVDQALAAVDRQPPPPPEADLAFYCGTEFIEMEAASCWTRLGRPEKAIDRYRRGLSTWPPDLERDRGLCVARLASAYVSTGDIDSLLELAPAAVALARRTGSGRTKRELLRLGRRLKPMRRDATVGQLVEDLATLETDIAC